MWGGGDGCGADMLSGYRGMGYRFEIGETATDGAGVLMEVLAWQRDMSMADIGRLRGPERKDGRDGRRTKGSARKDAVGDLAAFVGDGAGGGARQQVGPAHRLAKADISVYYRRRKPRRRLGWAAA